MKFREFIDVRDGTHSSPKSVKKGYHLVTTKNLKMNYIDFSKSNIISNTDFEKINRRSKVEQYDILLSMIGTVGNVYQERHKSINYAIKNIALLKFHGDELLSDWMNYFLQSMVGHNLITSRLSGSTQQFISLNDLRNLEIELPSRSKMKEIITPLMIIDRKMMSNKQINANLDELMSEIFERYVTEANVFTTDSLSNIANYKNGLAMQRFRPNGADKGLPVLKIKELNQGFTDSSSDRCSSKISNDVIVKTGDIIFSWSGTLIVKIWTGTTCGLNQHLFKVTSDKYPKWFIYKWTEYYLRQFQSIAAGKATTMGHIKRSDLKQAEVKIPHKSEIDRLDKLISPIFKRYVNNILEINSLKELKNELLSKIF